MEWEYKKIYISVNNEGFFIFTINGEYYKEYSLKNAKAAIDKKLGSYYNFTQKDMDKLLRKLDEREKELVRSLYNEVSVHINNAYCELGIVEKDWNWNWDLDK